MRVSVLLLCVLVCLALLDAAQGAAGPCRVRNCDVCKPSKPTKCRTCAPGFKSKRKGKKCKDTCPFDNCDECDRKGKKCVTCSAGYQLAGKQCEVDPCVPDPCQNGGSCSDGSRPLCTCTEGYEGDQCQTYIDPCNPNPCDNGGTCSEGTCACPTSTTSAFTGSHCDHEATFNWVVEVLDKSSEFTWDPLWSAIQVIGVPNVYPRHGDRRGAWAQSGHYPGDGFIEVRVANPLVVAGIQIYETNAGGGITRIALKQADGSWYTVWEGVKLAEPIVGEARIWTPTLEQTSFTTDSVRLEMNCDGYASTYCEIDAINLLG